MVYLRISQRKYLNSQYHTLSLSLAYDSSLSLSILYVFTYTYTCYVISFTSTLIINTRHVQNSQWLYGDDDSDRLAEAGTEESRRGTAGVKSCGQCEHSWPDNEKDIHLDLKLTYENGYLLYMFLLIFVGQLRVKALVVKACYCDHGFARPRGDRCGLARRLRGFFKNAGSWNQEVWTIENLNHHP